MTSLNISANNLAPIIGWRHEPNRCYKYYHSDGRKQNSKPESMGKPDQSGVIAFADGLKNNGALTSLNISNTDLGGYDDDEDEWTTDMTGIKALAAAIPKCK